MTTTQHPERRAGQRWKYTWFGKTYEFKLVERHIGVAGWDTDFPGLAPDEFWHPGAPQKMILISDVPAAAPLAADRTGCRPWCGMRQDVSRDHGRMAGEGIPDSPGNKGEADLWWCSNACKTALHPPLAAQPAKTRVWAQGSNDGVAWVYCDADYGKCSHRHHRATHVAPSKPAPQPEPAKPHDFSDPYCVVRRDVRACVSCGASEQGFSVVNQTAGCTPYPGWRQRFEIAIADNVAPYTGPERLGRPKLAHSFGVEDPALEDVS